MSGVDDFLFAENIVGYDAEDSEVTNESEESEEGGDSDEGTLCFVFAPSSCFADLFFCFPFPACLCAL
jgi:hypothetical protein